MALALAWPLVLGAGLAAAIHGEPRWLSATVSLVGSRICHQRPERSFHTAGAQWPVCGRCSGLYLAAPLGAIAALGRRRRLPREAAVLFAVAAVPSAITFALEFSGLAPVSNAARAVAALPLGAAVAYLVVGVVRTETRRETEARILS